MQRFEGLAQEDCKRLCDSSSLCQAFDFATNPTTDMGPVYAAGSCILHNATIGLTNYGADVTYANLGAYIKHGCQEWELFGGPGNVACRGKDVGDTDQSYYNISQSFNLSDCKRQCLAKLPHCKGVEYSYGRCEIWTRAGGIAAVKHLSLGAFTCQRFGWPARYLQPAEGGVGRACRGESVRDNSATHYDVVNAVHMEDCKARCTAASSCFGLEYSKGRCEIWRRPVRATANISGFTCLRYVLP